MINNTLKEDNKCADAYSSHALLFPKFKDFRWSEMTSLTALSIVENVDQKERRLLVITKYARGNPDFKIEIDALSEACRMINHMMTQRRIFF